MLHPEFMYDLIQQRNAELMAEADHERQSEHGRIRWVIRHPSATYRNITHKSRAR